MNPYLIISSLVLGIAGMAGAGWGGFRLGVDHQKAAETDKKELLDQAAGKAAQASAEAISKLKIVNTTIQNEVQHETRTHTVYVDCRHTADGLRLVNAALAGDRPQPAGGGQLPAPDPAGR
jgi:hypothetical protein